jgi:hypothetical protein
MCHATDVDVLDTRVIDGVTYRVYLVQDQDCESPRESGDSNAGVIATRTNRNCDWPAEDGDTVTADELRDAIEDHSFRVVARWLRIFHGASVVLPLYSTGQEGRPTAGSKDETPAAGNYVGVTFDQPSTRRATGVELADMDIALSVDVDEFSTWAVGEVYGYVIERVKHDESDPLGVDISDHAGWEHVDSCWGFIGYEYARSAAIGALSGI